MKIPSFLKIKKQAESYAKDHFSPCPQLVLELKELEKEQSTISKRWGKLRDDFCNGNPCICILHPRHGEFLDKLEPLNKRINEINSHLYSEKIKLTREKEKQLLKAKMAKESYQKRLATAV